MHLTISESYSDSSQSCLTRGLSNFHRFLYILTHKLSQMAMRPLVTRRWGCRLTGACLTAVRNSLQGFVGSRYCKRWEGRRIGLQTASPQTLWQMWGFVPPKGAKQRKGLWIKGLLQSFLCSALSPAAYNQRKGQAVAWLQASGAFPGKTKQLSVGAGSSPFHPSLLHLSL